MEVEERHKFFDNVRDAAEHFGRPSNGVSDAALPLLKRMVVIVQDRTFFDA